MPQPDPDLLRRLTMALDGCLPLLDKAAAAEKRREAHKPLRQITMQQRARFARELVAEACLAMGVTND